MTPISKEDEVVTLVNVFTVRLADQQRLVEMLVEAMENSMKHLPGFISANISVSEKLPQGA